MRVLVGLPTHNNVSSGYSIRNTLDGLASQTNRDFEVLLAYKPSPGDDTLGILDEYRSRMNIEVAVQRDGFIEEAWNTILGASGGHDLLLTVDDDAVPGPGWIQEYVNLFQDHANLGIASFHGTSHRNLLLDRAKRLFGYQVPLLPVFKEYADYINDMGFMVLARRLEPGLVLSIGLAGCTMGVRLSLVGPFELPCVTVRGIAWETALALHVIKQGGHSALTKSGRVSHLDRDSLARPKSLLGVYGVGIERPILLYSVNRQQPINIRRLRRYAPFASLYGQLDHTTLSVAFVEGLTIARDAVEEEWEPSRVRRAIEESTSAFAARHHLANDI
jgi:glycosyltransferase involved in cell wall biosynthesis